MEAKIAFLLFLIFLSIQPVKSQTSWYANFTPGLSAVAPAPLYIRQSGFEDISMRANYKTYPLKLPLYYSYRLGFQNEKNLWEVEMNHLKIYLNNTTELVEWFAVSHGYNQIFVNHSLKFGKISQKAGIGIVLAHPENTVRGRQFDIFRGLFGGGFYFNGFAAQYVLYKEIPLLNFLYLEVEGKASIGYAIVPIVEGKAHVPVAALHFLIGPGLRIKKGTPSGMPSQ